MADTSGQSVPTVGVHDPAGQSQYYIVIITSSRHGTVQAWLPDSIQLIVKTSWGPIAGNIESALGNWIGTGGILADSKNSATFFSKKLTAQEWRGVEPLELVLQLHFFATQDASKEVVEPIKRLIKMALPTQINESFFGLRAPGPVPAPVDLSPLGLPDKILGIPIPKEIGGGGKEFEDIINVYIGNFLSLREVFIPSLPTIEFKGTLSTDGLPMQGLCTVVFRTVYAPTVQDIETYLGTAPLGAPGFVTAGRPALS